MMLAKYWGLMFIQLYSLFWLDIASTSAIDLTLIGHIKGWKSIKYWKWLSGAIPYLRGKRWYGCNTLKDQMTHPQVLWFLLVAFIVLLGIVGLIIGVWQFVNDVDAWVLWSIDGALYLPSIIWLIVFRKYVKKVYFAFLEKTNKE